MKRKLIALCMFFVVVFLSCKKDDLSDAGTSGNPSVLKLSKVLIDNQSADEYVYNNLNLVIEEKSKLDYMSNRYNEKGQLVSTDYYGNEDLLSSDLQIFQAAMNNKVWVTPANGVKCGTMTYEYNVKGQLTKSIYSRQGSAISEYSEFSYDANNRVIRQTMYWENVVNGYIDYSYDAKGNMIKEMLFNPTSSGIAELITTTQYSFDSERNPFKYAGNATIPGINTNLNNIIKETYTIHFPADQGSDKIEITSSTYAYNGIGYPITKNSNVSYVYQ
jgi:hypothetical protein